MKNDFKKIMLETGVNFGTPVYLYDSESIKEKFNYLKFNLPDYIEIFYSMKANPTLAICEYLRLLGANCEISSKCEFYTALHAGFNKEQIIFAGPGKSLEEIEQCLSKIKLFICESIDEIKLINNLSYKMNIRTNILIRINPDFKIKEALIKMSGVASQFGMDLKTISDNIHDIKKYEHIHIHGIQIYNASRVLNIEAIIENITKILDLSLHLSKEWEIDFKTIDVGGGFGVPYFENEKTIDPEILTKSLTVIFKKFHQKFPAIKIIMELGRYVVAESGFLISKINYIKNNHHKNFLVVDAGLHCHMAATGLGSFMQRNFPIEFISKNEVSKKSICYQIAGPLCTPSDILFKDVLLPEANPGDFIVIKNSGAYGLTASMTRFLSHGSPAEVFYYQNNLHLIRRRETPEDMLETQYHLTGAIVNRGEKL